MNNNLNITKKNTNSIDSGIEISGVPPSIIKNPKQLLNTFKKDLISKVDTQTENYPPIKKTKLTDKKKMIQYSHKTKKIIVKSTNGKKRTIIKKIKTKVNKIPTKNKDIEWGLGVEHEFMMCFDASGTKNFTNSILEKINGTIDTKRKKEINKVINGKNKFYYVIPYIDNFDMKEVNIEASGLNNLPMYEIKNMKFYNVNIKDIVNELNDQRERLNNNLVKVLSTKINRKLTPIETRFGAENLIFNTCPNNGYFSFQDNPGFECIGVDNIKTDVDYTGSYHFWITLPYHKNDTKENIMLLHQKSIFLLQSIEPLLCAYYGSCDPTINKTNKNRLIRGSYRTANNIYANFGMAPGYNYNGFDMYARIVKKMQSRKLNIESYIDKLKKSLRKPLKLSEYPDYIQFVHSDSPWGYGTDFRRKYGIKGFEFRIWDHFPQKYLSDVLKVVYLLATHTYDIDHKDLTYPFDNEHWHTSMFECLMNGYQGKISSEYIEFINSQFSMNLDAKNTTTSIFEELITKLYKKVLSNEKHHYWTLSGETPKNHKKPKIHNFNKQSQDTALGNK
jgi:hypothetical protein